MRSLLSTKLHWFALGVGILILVAGASITRSLFQADQNAGSLPLTNEGRLAGPETAGQSPGLPARNNMVNDLTEPDFSRVGPGLIAADDVATNDPPGRDSGGVDPGMIVAEDVAMSDLTELEIREGGPPAPRDGPGEVASVQDGAALVVRDAEGNIKQRERVR